MTVLPFKRPNPGERSKKMSKKKKHDPPHNPEYAPPLPKIYRCLNTPCRIDTWELGGNCSMEPDHCPYCGSKAIERVPKNGKKNKRQE
ncbi:hypothetical protein KJ885_03535 [Patescibacteria group bacterium]|nr:hypothetical protein [Patescibacteria group bacterium]